MRSFLVAALGTFATSASALSYLNDDRSITGHLCVGDECTDTQTWNSADTLVLKGPNLRIKFEDVGDPEGFPIDDWRIEINDTTSGGDKYFAVGDVSSGTQPFKVRNAAPSHSLVINDTDGYIGMGTAFPQQPLHIVTAGYPRIRMESTLSTPGVWDISAYSGAFEVRDQIGSTTPLSIAAGAPSWALIVKSDGKVGLGDYSPEGGLDLQRSDGTARVQVEELNATTSPRTLLNLVNNGRPEIVLANSATGGEWSFGAGTNFILKQGAVGSASNAKTKLFEVTDTGDATLAGSLTTGGTTCGGGCDRVFSERAIIPEADYAEAMWSQGFLPHVGPT
ncbi:MAG: hypothetical protein R3D85_14440, partial [Paracoccaceae bacterium]